MPRFLFWFTDHDAIAWSFDRHPDVGEEIALGVRGVFRVTGPHARPVDPTVDAGYAVVRLRDSTLQDFRAQHDRGMNKLPPR